MKHYLAALEETIEDQDAHIRRLTQTPRAVLWVTCAVIFLLGSIAWLEHTYPRVDRFVTEAR